MARPPWRGRRFLHHHLEEIGEKAHVRSLGHAAQFQAHCDDVIIDLVIREPVDLLANGIGAARLIMRPLRNTERVLNNAAVERLLAKEKELGSAIKFEDIFAEVAGVYPRIMKNGEMEAGAWSCGMVVGLIHDIPTCKELVDRIMTEADEIIRGRLEKLAAA